jgi:hypothetical protein
MQTSSRILVVAAAIAGGCFSVRPPGGIYACNPGDCPDGYSCGYDHYCWPHPPTEPGGDLSSPRDLAPPSEPDMRMCEPATSCPVHACGTISDGCGGAIACTPCQLTALTPPMANADAEVTLEGTFDGTVMVDFPGAPGQKATILGPHRARVAVPTGATAGDLSVATGTAAPVTVGHLPFRRASFALGRGPSRSEYEQTNGARQMSTMATPQGRLGASAAVIGPFLYVVGGQWCTEVAGGNLASVERATINADGTLSSFASVDDVMLTHSSAYHTSVVTQNWWYIIGSSSDNVSVERAQIGSDGSLSTFSVVPDVQLRTPRLGPASVVIGNVVYVIGGYDPANGALATIERAVINADGTLGPFTLLPDITLPVPVSDATVAVIGDGLYVFGGRSGDRQLANVQRASIAGDGSLSDFALVGTSTLQVPRSRHRTIVLGDAVYQVGGMNIDRNVINSVERATINADGSLTNFSLVPELALKHAREAHIEIVIGNSIYSIGGGEQARAKGNGENTTPTVERASINASGTLSGFSDSPIALSQGRSNGRSVVLGQNLYVIGGASLDSYSERAGVDPDGSLTPFVAEPMLFIHSRAGHATAVLGRYLYILGGSGPSGILTDVQRAIISGDGSLGTFDTMASGLTIGRASFTTAVVANNLYVLGGHDLTSPDGLTSVEVAPIAADGTLGAFGDAGVALNPGTAMHTSAVLGSYVYVIGGEPGNRGAVERASILPNGALSSFTSVSPDVKLTAPQYGHTSELIGDKLYVLGGSERVLAVATVALDGTLSPFKALATPFGPRFLSSSAVVGGSTLYVIAGGTDVTPVSTTITRALLTRLP